MGISHAVISEELKEIERQAKTKKFRVKVTEKAIEKIEQQVKEDPIMSVRRKATVSNGQ